MAVRVWLCAPGGHGEIERVRPDESAASRSRHVEQVTRVAPHARNLLNKVAVVPELINLPQQRLSSLREVMDGYLRREERLVAPEGPVRTF